MRIRKLVQQKDEVKPCDYGSSIILDKYFRISVGIMCQAYIGTRTIQKSARVLLQVKINVSKPTLFDVLHRCRSVLLRQPWPCSTRYRHAGEGDGKIDCMI
jgi:hypothetical protein